MTVLRRFALLAVVVAGFAVLSSPAFAARDGSLPLQVDSTNFRVHYQSDAVNLSTYAITATQAGDIAALAERALAAETADGYPMPPSDGALGGDGRIDIYVEDFSSFPGVLGTTSPDFVAPTTSSYIDLAGNLPEQAFTQHTIAHELFHAIQFGIWFSTRTSDYWLYEASAEWMGFRADGYPAPTGVGPADMSLDCRDPFGNQECNLTDAYLGNGYSRWPFFEYLVEQYGSSFVKDIFAQGVAGSPSTTATGALSAALVAKGTTLADTYDNWIAADVSSAYTVPSLQAKPPEVYGAPISTGTATTTLPVQKVTVNHLATRILQFDRGGGSATGACYAATLGLTVTLPAGTSSKPVFYWNMPGTPLVALSVNGNTATAAIPWDTCQWPTAHGYLALPNASTTVDAGDFLVKTTLTVDFSTAATASDPPPGVTLTSPAIPVSSADPAPTLSVFGPQLLKLSPTMTQIRLIVESNGSGALQATLGTVQLGSQALRIGNNDLRFALPAGVLQALRRSASTSNMVLTLTPRSTSGTAGVAVTRTVAVTAPAKSAAKKPAKKPATKKKTASAKKHSTTKKSGTK